MIAPFRTAVEPRYVDPSKARTVLQQLAELSSLVAADPNLAMILRQARSEVASLLASEERLPERIRRAA